MNEIMEKSISVIGKVDDFNESTQGVTFICKFKDQLLLFDPVRAGNFI